MAGRRAFADAAGALQFGIAVAGQQAAALADVFGEMPGQQQPVVERQAGRHLSGQVEHDGGAVAGQGVVEARPVADAAGLVEIAEEQLPQRRARHVEPVQVDILAAGIAAGAHDVVLVGGDQHALELAEEAAEGGERLAALLADLQREHQPAAVVEAERDQGVGDVRTHPVRQDQVGVGQAVEVVLAGFPAHGVVVFAVPVEITHVAKGEPVAVDLGLQQLCDVVGPVAFVRGPQRRPSAYQRQQAQQPGQCRQARSTARQADGRAQPEQAPRGGERDAQPVRTRPLEPQ